MDGAVRQRRTTRSSRRRRQDAIERPSEGNNLYVATMGHRRHGGNDHFIFVTDTLGDASPAPGPRPAMVFFDTDDKPTWRRRRQRLEALAQCRRRSDANCAADALEGEINLIDAFGYVPEALYIAAVAYGTRRRRAMVAQGPARVGSDDNVEIMEFLRVPSPASATRPGRPFRRRQAPDVDRGRTATPTTPTTACAASSSTNWPAKRASSPSSSNRMRDGNTVTDVELFTNINRRDFAVMEEDPDTVTAASRHLLPRLPHDALGGEPLQLHRHDQQVRRLPHQCPLPSQRRRLRLLHRQRPAPGLRGRGLPAARRSTSACTK